MHTTYYSYHQALAILEKRLGATDREVAVWVFMGDEIGGINAYTDVYGSPNPHRATLDEWSCIDGISAHDPAEPDYLLPLQGMFFRQDKIEKFDPKDHRYISFDTLKARWLPYCRTERLTVEAIKTRIDQSRLTDFVPGFGFSRLSPNELSSALPAEWAMFSVKELETIEAQDFPGLHPRPTAPDQTESKHVERVDIDSQKTHIDYLSKLQKKFPSATAKELRKQCELLVNDEISPFHLWKNQLALRGKLVQISEKTFANWLAEARKMV